MDGQIINESSTSNNKAILATGGYDHTIKLWQAHAGVCYWTGQHADSVFTYFSVSLITYCSVMVRIFTS